MPKIERRRTTVTLYQGHYEQQLADLLDQAMAAQRKEERGQKRNATKSQSMALAVEHDELVTEAEVAAVKIDLHEISNTEWQRLADGHPPREDDASDKRQGVNMKTFPAVLLAASMKESDLDLGDLSRFHYAKLETAAWNLHAGDDALPKYSLVSLLKRQRDPDSKQPRDSE